jgi:hypothetical protein
MPITLLGVVCDSKSDHVIDHTLTYGAILLSNTFKSGPIWEIDHAQVFDINKILRILWTAPRYSIARSGIREVNKMFKKLGASDFEYLHWVPLHVPFLIRHGHDIITANDVWSKA